MPENSGGGRVYVIAEAGVNHNGEADMALALVDAAVDAGADAVKFQTFQAGSLATGAAPKAEYQKQGTDPAKSQIEMLRALELSPDTHRRLLDRCGEKKIDFLSTPFDEASLEFLVNGLGLTTIKISSGDVTNGPLLLAAAGYGVDVILSTGMSTLEEVGDALGVLAFGYAGNGDAPSLETFRAALASDAGRACVRNKVTVLHCTTEYPAAYGDTNLRAMDTLREAFDVRTGLSDHTPGITVPIAAAARDACIVEKHFTLDRTLPGPDHPASLEPGELNEMVLAIRAVEEAMGNGVKAPRKAERKNMPATRKSLVALRPIAKGEPFSPDNLGVKRPGSGETPMGFWARIGRPADRDFDADEVIEP